MAGVVSLIGGPALGAEPIAAARLPQISQVTLRTFTLEPSGIVLELHPTEARITLGATSSSPIEACEYRGSWGSPFSKHWKRCIGLGRRPVVLPSSGGAIHVSVLILPTSRKAAPVSVLLLRWHCVDHDLRVKPRGTRIRPYRPTFDC